MTSTRSPTFGSPTIFVCAFTCTRNTGAIDPGGPGEMVHDVPLIELTVPVMCISVDGGLDFMMDRATFAPALSTLIRTSTESPTFGSPIIFVCAFTTTVTSLPRPLVITQESVPMLLTVP